MPWACPSHPPPLTHLSSFQTHWPPVYSFSLSWPLPPQGLCTRGSLFLKLFLLSSAPLTIPSSLESLLRYHPLEGSFPTGSLPRPSLAALGPLLQLLWAVYLQHVFLPEPGRKWNRLVFCPQEETAPSSGGWGGPAGCAHQTLPTPGALPSGHLLGL